MVAYKVRHVARKAYNNTVYVENVGLYIFIRAGCARVKVFFPWELL